MWYFIEMFAILSERSYRLYLFFHFRCGQGQLALFLWYVFLQKYMKDQVYFERTRLCIGDHLEILSSLQFFSIVACEYPTKRFCCE